MWQGNSLAGGILAVLCYLEGGDGSRGGGKMVVGAVMVVTAAVSSNLCTRIS